MSNPQDNPSDKPETAHVDQPAVEQSPENLPAPGGAGTEVRSAGQRRGMFGVSGTGDTSGYGGLVAPIVFPSPVPAPVRRVVRRGRRRPRGAAAARPT